MPNAGKQSRIVTLVWLIVLVVFGGLLWVALNPQQQASKPSPSAGDDLFGLFSTDKLCSRLQSEDFSTRETALIAMQSFHNVMPVYAGEALCTAIVTGHVKVEGKEEELVRYHVSKHPDVIVPIVDSYIAQYESTGRIVLCDGTEITPSSEYIAALRSLRVKQMSPDS